MPSLGLRTGLHRRHSFLMHWWSRCRGPPRRRRSPRPRPRPPNWSSRSSPPGNASRHLASSTTGPASQVQTLQGQITSTQTKIAAARKQVGADQAALRAAAINDFVTNGQAASENQLFADNQTLLAQQQEFSRVAEGDVTVALADLHNAQAQLSQQEAHPGLASSSRRSPRPTPRQAPRPRPRRCRTSRTPPWVR